MYTFSSSQNTAFAYANSKMCLRPLSVDVPRCLHGPHTDVVSDLRCLHDSHNDVSDLKCLHGSHNNVNDPICLHGPHNNVVDLPTQ